MNTHTTYAAWIDRTDDRILITSETHEIGDDGRRGATVGADDEADSIPMPADDPDQITAAVEAAGWTLAGRWDAGSAPVEPTRTAPHPDDVRAALAEAGARRAQAGRAQAEAMVDIGDWLRRGQEAGVPISEMATLAGVSRPTVYQHLDTETSPARP